MQEMLWKDINDSWNQEIILKEINCIKYFISPSKDTFETSVTTSSENVINLSDDVNSSKDVIDNTILTLDYKILNPLQILEHQIKVINYLLKLFKVTRLQEINDYEPYLLWIYNTSEYLALSIHQTINRTKSNTLIRSSYKFCNKKCDCQSHYGFLFQKKTKCCINDHYVHHKVAYDIINLIDYLKRHIYTDHNKVIVETELKKGLETINYVLNHMYQELSSFMLYLGKSKYTVKDFYRCH